MGGNSRMSETKLESIIRDAVKLHGHLGPFLVIGVRMGTVAKRILASSGNKDSLSRVVVKVPLRTPYSCILDGIQIVTKCTIGNQRLKVEDSPEEITAEFQAQDANNTLILSTNPRIIGEIENAFSRGTTNEELAERIASAAEEQLFELKRR